MSPSGSASNNGYTGSSVNLTPHTTGQDQDGGSDHTYDEVDTRPHHHSNGSSHHHVTVTPSSSSWHHVTSTIPSRAYHVNRNYVGSRDELRVYKDEGADHDVDDLSAPGDGDVGDIHDFDESHFSGPLHPKLSHVHAHVHSTNH